MSQATQELRVRGDTQVGDVDHFFCCDENMALCGTDLSGVPMGPEFPADCPMCVLVSRRAQSCGAAGCLG